MTTIDDKVYKVGRIYKLYSHINEYYYIGSSNGTLRDRMYNHKQGTTSKKMKEWINDIMWENIKIIELKVLKDVTKKQTKIVEDEIIKNCLNNEHCLNCIRAYITNKERKDYLIDYHNNHKDHKRNYDKQYRDENHIAIKGKKKLEYEKDRDKIKDRSKKRYENNKDQILEEKRLKRQWDKVYNFITY